MSKHHLDPAALEEYLPHRDVNLFLDEVILADDGLSAVSHTTVGEDDPRRRGIFGRSGPGPGSWWYTPFLGELLALTGVTLLKDRLTGDQVAVFSSIAKLDIRRPVRMAADVEGHARIDRDRGPFTQFGAEVRSEEDTILTGEILSGVSTLHEICDKPVTPLTDPTAGEEVDPGLFAFKSADLRFIDRVLDWDPERGHLRGSYTYPADHPFTTGHFPGAPIMMGMTQWAAAADAGYLAMRRAGLERAVVQANLHRPNGDPIFNARDLVLEVGADGPRTVSARRLAFRGVVIPGDGIVLEVGIAAC